jgi:hemoglobin
MVDGIAEIDEDGLKRLVALFYQRVRSDPALGPIFNDVISDWPAHQEQLCAFWSSVMLTSGRYKGNPMAAHMKHAGRITPELFTRWLALWNATAAEIMPAAAATALQAKAARIAESLQLALFYRPNPHSAGRPAA